MNNQQKLANELAELDDLEKALMMKKCKDDPWIFLTGYPMSDRWTPGPSKGFVWTLDEHDKEHPFKRFPNKKYLWYTAKRWLEEPVLIVSKSRQILITWLMVALHLWDFQFHRGRLDFFQNKKEEDANAMLDRAKFIYDNEPEELRLQSPVIKIGEKWAYCKMEGEKKRGTLNAYSKIKAIPQGPDILRLHTSSKIFTDEHAFQDKAEEGYTAARPTLDGGGEYTSVSTSNGKSTFFYKLKSGEYGEEQGKTVYSTGVKGVKEWRTSIGLVLEIHYSADPDKDPDTEKGAKWYKETRAKYSLEAWEREFEINDTMGSGNKIFHDFKKSLHAVKMRYSPELTLYRAWDFGYHHPAVVFAQINGKDQLCVLAELMGTDIALPEFKIQAKAFTERHFPKAKIRDVKDSDDFIRHIITKDFCDPHGNDKLGVNKNAKSYVDIMRSEPYRVLCRFRRAPKDVKIELVRDLLLLREDGETGIIIDIEKCPLLIEGMEGGYHSKKNDPDQPDDDGFYEHTQDCLQELVLNLHRKLGLLTKRKIQEGEKEMKKNSRVTPLIKKTYNKFTGY